MRVVTVALVGLLELAGCAGAPGKAGADAPGAKVREGQMTASRIYTAAEARIQEGRFEEGIQLLRHAVLQLPPDEHADALRHKLILRVAHVQMLAYDKTKNRDYLADAENMLTRYADKHTALFGETDAAQQQRADVYEILYHVETLGETPVAAEADTRPEDTVQAEVVADASDRTEVVADEDDAPVDAHAGEDLEAEQTRIVRVKTARLASPDDPRVRERLESDFSSAEAGPVLTAPGIGLVHGPRGLVRANRRPTAADSGSREDKKLARTLGRELLRSVRPELRRCYEQAFARRLVPVAEGTVEVSILPDGTVERVRVTDGGLVDGLGDACLIERIEGTKVSVDATRRPVRLRIPLVFFHQNAVYIDEASGRTFSGSSPAMLEREQDPVDAEAIPRIDGSAPP